MSFGRTFLFPLLVMALAIGMGGSAMGEEAPRIWTNKNGKTVKGVMKGKGEDWVEIEVKGKVFKLPLAKLSEKDQEYVKKTTIHPPLVVKTKLTSRKAADIDFDVKTLTVDLKNIREGQRIYGLLVWVTQLRTNKGLGVKSHVEAFYEQDGDHRYEVSVSNNRKVGESYRGYALRLLDEEGQVLFEKGEPSSYTRYLDKVFARNAPTPKKKGKRKKGKKR